MDEQDKEQLDRLVAKYGKDLLLESVDDPFVVRIKQLIYEADVEPAQAAVLLLQHMASGGFQCTEGQALEEVQQLFKPTRRH